MEIIIRGAWLDGSGEFEDYLCLVGETLPETDCRDENYFYYFESEEDIPGTHLDFIVYDWEAV